MDEITIALAKGRLAQETIDLLNKIGIRFSEYRKGSRKLIFEDEEAKIRIILVKAPDVPIYVEKGAADLGIVGKDTLMEAEADVFEVMDLGFGRCKFAVATIPSNSKLEKQKLIVATKYPKVAKAFYAQKGYNVEIVQLNGSVELAPLAGLADVIVDIVETGQTLKENGLEVVEEISQLSARLIVNKASFKTKSQRIHHFISNLQAKL